MSEISVLACEFPVGHLGREGGKCLGIDVAAGRAAPSNEVGGACLRLDGVDALVTQALEVLLRSGFPFAERAVPASAGED